MDECVNDEDSDFNIEEEKNAVKSKKKYLFPFVSFVFTSFVLFVLKMIVKNARTPTKYHANRKNARKNGKNEKKSKSRRQKSDKFEVKPNSSKYSNICSIFKSNLIFVFCIAFDHMYLNIKKYIVTE